MTKTIANINVGDTVVRTKGRPEDLGKRGIVTAVHGDEYGSGALLTVTDSADATTWHTYKRMVKLVSSAP